MKQIMLLILTISVTLCYGQTIDLDSSTYIPNISRLRDGLEYKPSPMIIDNRLYTIWDGLKLPVTDLDAFKREFPEFMISRGCKYYKHGQWILITDKRFKSYIPFTIV